ncbi:MAG: adenosylhomocysteinase [Chloroflexi bacterium]|nr:adenosylhomocysteinase [Chloroflexota bacterium]MBV9897213.1 adenosylhomocysteinase [Chloroflexota bacterium]
MISDVTDPSLAETGLARVRWAEGQMPVLRSIRERFTRERPLAGLRVGACLHVTTETANLMIALKAAGASVALCASNPLSTQDDVAAALTGEFGIPTFAIKGEDELTYYRHIESVLATRPNITMDDGCDLVNVLHTRHAAQLEDVRGGTEATTTGVIRLRAMVRDGQLRFPVVAVNEALTKHMFDNRYGTGQSTLDGLIRATNVLLAGQTFVVCGYGWCGRGLATRAHGMGAQVIVTEVDPARALEALMDGYRVMPLIEACKVADVIITVTGDLNVVDKQHFQAMKDGCIVANSGHFDDEVNIPALRALSRAHRTARPLVEEYELRDGRRIYLLAEGRVLNLASAEGHPATVMDMSFANQALCAVYIAQHADALAPGVYDVPEDIDQEVARLKLASLGVRIDELTDEQRRYLASWDTGT